MTAFSFIKMSLLMLPLAFGVAQDSLQSPRIILGERDAGPALYLLPTGDSWNGSTFLVKKGADKVTISFFLINGLGGDAFISCGSESVKPASAPARFESNASIPFYFLASANSREGLWLPTGKSSKEITKSIDIFDVKSGAIGLSTQFRVAFFPGDKITLLDSKVEVKITFIE